MSSDTAGASGGEALLEEAHLSDAASRQLLAAPSPPKPKPPPACFKKCLGDYQNVGAICYRPNSTTILCPNCRFICDLKCDVTGYVKQGCNCFRIESRYKNEPCTPPTPPPRPKPPPACFQPCPGDYKNVGAICYRPNSTYLLCPSCTRLKPCALTCKAGYTKQGCNCFRLEDRYANKPCSPPPPPPRPSPPPQPKPPPVPKPSPPSPPPAPPACRPCPAFYTDAGTDCYRNNVVYRKTCSACQLVINNPVGRRLTQVGTLGFSGGIVPVNPNVCYQLCAAGFTDRGCTCFRAQERISRTVCPPPPAPPPPVCMKCPVGYADGNSFCYKNDVLYRKQCSACAGGVLSPVGGAAACHEACAVGYTEQLGCTCYTSGERINKVPC